MGLNGGVVNASHECYKNDPEPLHGHVLHPTFELFRGLVWQQDDTLHQPQKHP